MSTIGNWRGPNIIKDGLFLYLNPNSPNSFYDTSSTIIKDISGNGNNGTLINGPTYNSNNGGSIVLDGTNDYLNTNIGIKPTSTTIEVVCSIISNTSIKTGGNTVAQYIVFRQNTRTSNFEAVVLNYIQSGLTGYFEGTMSSSGGLAKQVSTPLINLNQIYSLTATYDSNNITLYLNGQFVSQTSTGFPIDYNLVHTYKLGRADAIGQTFDGYLNGKIYDVRFYDRTLTSSEILQNYNSTKSRFGL
jgi:hypothetical protein